MKSLLALCCLLCLVRQVAAREHARAVLYLLRYGYVSPGHSTAAMMAQDRLTSQVRTAVLDFQAFAGLNQTGELDAETLELMETPRCGVRDMVGHGATARRKKR